MKSALLAVVVLFGSQMSVVAQDMDMNAVVDGLNAAVANTETMNKAGMFMGVEDLPQWGVAVKDQAGKLGRVDKKRIPKSLRD